MNKPYLVKTLANTKWSEIDEATLLKILELINQPKGSGYATNTT